MSQKRQKVTWKRPMRRSGKEEFLGRVATKDLVARCRARFSFPEEILHVVSGMAELLCKREGGFCISALTANSPATVCACTCVQAFHTAD